MYILPQKKMFRATLLVIIKKKETLQISISLRLVWRRGYSMAWPLFDYCRPGPTIEVLARAEPASQIPSETVWSTPPYAPGSSGLCWFTGCGPPLVWDMWCPSTHIHPALSPMTLSHATAVWRTPMSSCHHFPRRPWHEVPIIWVNSSYNDGVDSLCL